MSISALAASEPESFNLIKNSSFEVIDDEGELPDLWGTEVTDWAHRRTITGKKYHGIFSLDETTSKFGKKSLKIEKTRGEIVGLKHDIFGLEAGETYTLSGYIKTGKIGNEGARIAIYYHSDQLIAAESVAAVSELNTDWKRVNCAIKIPGKETVGMGKGFVTSVCCQVYGASSKSAWFDGLQLVKGSKPLTYNPEPAYLRVTAGRKNLFMAGRLKGRFLYNNIFYSSENPYINLKAVSHKEIKPLEVEIEVKRIYPELSKPVETRSKPVDAKVEKPIQFKIDLEKQPRIGTYAVDAVLKNETGKILTRANTIFHVIPPRTASTNPDKSPFEGHVLDRYVISKLGLSHQFIAPRWRDFNPAQGVFRFENYFWLFDAPQGIYNHYMVIKTPNWAADESFLDKESGLTELCFCPPKKWEYWDTFLEKLLENYKGKIRYLQVNAEQEAHWYGGPESYYKYLKRTYQLVKRIDPTIEIIYGGVSPYRCLNYFEETFKLGALEYCDIVAAHLYVTTWPEKDDILEKTYDKLNKLIEKYSKGKPIRVWNTETNYPMEYHGNEEVLTEEDFANAIVRTHAISLSVPYLERITWWGCGLWWWKLKWWRNGFIRRAENLSGYRVVPALFAYSGMTAMLSTEPSFLTSINVKNDPHKNARIYVFRRMDKKLVAILWRPGKETKIQIKLNKTRCEVFDINGNSIILSDPETPWLPFGPSPIYLIFEEASLEEVNDLLKHSVIVPVTREMINPIKMEILPIHERLKDSILVPVKAYNYSLAQAELTVSLIPSKETALQKQERNISIPPEDAKIIHFSVPISTPREFNQYEFGVFASSDGKTFRTEVIQPTKKRKLPVIAETPLYGKLAEAKGKLSFFICPFAKERPVIDADINDWKNALPFWCDKAEQVQLMKDWRGPDDLSAVVYAQWDKDNFYLSAKVWDDNAVRTKSWVGDAIQIYFGLEDPQKTSYGHGRDLGVILGMEKDGPKVYLATKGKMRNPKLEERIRLKILMEPHNIPFPDITYYEVAIPWDLFEDFKPGKGKELRFNIVFNDSEDGKNYRGSIGWTRGIVGNLDVTKFDNLRLIKE